MVPPSPTTEGLTREEYVRLICEGYIALKLPIPPEYWDEWEAICEVEAKQEKTPEEELLDFPPDPLQVWAVMVGGGTFMLKPDGPATHGSIKLTAITPMTGMLDYCTLMRPDGEVLCNFQVNCNAMVAGDSLHVMIDAEQMLTFLKP